MIALAYYMTGAINYIDNELAAEEIAAKNCPAIVKWIKEDNTYSVVTLSAKPTHSAQKTVSMTGTDHMFIQGAHAFQHRDQRPRLAHTEFMRGYNAAERASK
jgi:hypothetical protein